MARRYGEESRSDVEFFSLEEAIAFVRSQGAVALDPAS